MAVIIVVLIKLEIGRGIDDLAEIIVIRIAAVVITVVILTKQIVDLAIAVVAAV